MLSLLFYILSNFAAKLQKKSHIHKFTFVFKDVVLILIHFYDLTIIAAQEDIPQLIVYADSHRE
jgi:hypothetical protein